MFGFCTAATLSAFSFVRIRSVVRLSDPSIRGLSANAISLPTIWDSVLKSAVRGGREGEGRIPAAVARRGKVCLAIGEI